MDNCHNTSKKKYMQTNEPVILVIDDSNFIHAYMKSILAPVGCKVVTANNGIEGINLFRQYNPAVVFIDAHMPMMDGFNTCNVIRSMGNGKDALLYMITTDDTQKTIDKAFESGFDDYYKKPFQMDTVFTTKIKKFVKRSKSRSDYENIKKQLHKTKALQNILLPHSFSNSCVKVTHIYSPLEDVSGDMLDYWWDKKDKSLNGYILDAMGHGVSAAMNVSAIRMLFCQATSCGLKLDSAFSYINSEFYRSNTNKTASRRRSTSTITTAILFRINFSENTMQYVSAGISPFFVTTKDGTRPVVTKGLPLGYTAKVQYKIENMPLEGIREVIFCSDGFSDLYFKEEVLGKHDDASAIIIKILGG